MIVFLDQYLCRPLLIPSSNQDQSVCSKGVAPTFGERDEGGGYLCFEFYRCRRFDSSNSSSPPRRSAVVRTYRKVLHIPIREKPYIQFGAILLQARSSSVPKQRKGRIFAAWVDDNADYRPFGFRGGRSLFGRALFTLMFLPPTVVLSKDFMASAASESFGMSIKPNPFDRFVCLSMIMFTFVTSPNFAKTPLNSSSVIE